MLDDIVAAPIKNMKSIAGLIIFGICFLGINSGFSQNSKAAGKKLEQNIETLVSKAYALYEQGDYAAAGEVYDLILKLDDQNAIALFYLELIPDKISQKEKYDKEQQAYIPYHQALSLYSNKQYQQALEGFGKVERICPDYKRTKYYLEKIPLDMKEEGKLKKEGLDAQSSGQKASVEKARDRAAALLDDGYRLYEEEKYLEAKIFYEKVIELDPGNSVALFYLERIPDKMKEKEKYAQAPAQVKIIPQKVTVKEKKESGPGQKAAQIYQQGVSLYKNKEYKPALDKFEEVKTITPDYKDTRRYIKRISARLQKIEKNKAKEEKLKQTAAEKKYNEACLLYNNQDYRHALEKYKQLGAFYPGYKDTFIYIHRINRVLEEDKINSLLKEGQILYEDGHFGEAGAIFETIIKFQPQNAAALTYLKQLSSKIKDKEESKDMYVQMYQEAVELYELKQYPSALKKFKEVKNILPDYDRTNHYVELISKAIIQEREQNF